MVIHEIKSDDNKKLLRRDIPLPKRYVRAIIIVGGKSMKDLQLEKFYRFTIIKIGSKKRKTFTLFTAGTTLKLQKILPQQ
jgi:hypothetical protein